MILRNIRKEDLVVGNKVVEIQSGNFYHVYRIEKVTNHGVVVDSTYVIYRGRNHSEEINGINEKLILNIDSYSDDQIGLYNRDLNVYIELLLEEEGN